MAAAVGWHVLCITTDGRAGALSGSDGTRSVAMFAESCEVKPFTLLPLRNSRRRLVPTFGDVVVRRARRTIAVAITVAF